MTIPGDETNSDQRDIVSINHDELTIADVVAVARHHVHVEAFRGRKRDYVQKVRDYVEETWLTADAEPKYGFNTGIGSLKNVKISADKIKQFQVNYVKSHCVGVGQPLAIEIVRGAILIQANALSKGYSGVRALIVDKLIEMLNKEVHPVVPEQGSLGASGDLAPLTHITAVLVGEDDAEIWIDGRPVQLKSLKKRGRTLHFSRETGDVDFEAIELHGKEAVSLTNATAVMLSIGCLLVHDVGLLLKSADIAASLSLEAMMCEQDAFAAELHALRNQAGQIRTANNIRMLTKNSKRMTGEARMAYFESTTEKEIKARLRGSDQEALSAQICEYKLNHEFDKNRVQDAYSLRCVPQVHGACKDAFEYVRSVIRREISAVTDNPVIFENENGDGFYAHSGGNFHGEPLGLALDFLAIAVSEIGSISERRTFRMLSPGMSFGLPRNLTGGEAGVNSGYMLLQYTAAQLVSENKILSHPASVDSVPTSENQEDHVSMGMTAARKARQVLENVQNLIAVEILAATQAIFLSSSEASVDLTRFPLGQGTARAFNLITAYEDPANGLKPFLRMNEDDYLQSKLRSMVQVVKDGYVPIQLGDQFRIEI